jgi:lipoprotein-anchoring transpeptidase ErfK/SrfK
VRTFAVIVAVLAALLTGVWVVAQQSSGVPAAVPAPTVAAAAARHDVAPATKARVDHCAHNRAPQLVLVSIADQRAWLCARRRTVYTTAVTTGMRGRATATPTGHFRVQGRDRDTVLRPDGGGAYRVKYWIPFDAPAYGFHDASWQKVPFGGPGYRTGGSHGCVHMPLKAVAFLYRWVHVGAAVIIRG